MPNFSTRVKFDNRNRDANVGHRVGDLFADAAGDLSGTTAPGGANGDGTEFDIPSSDSSYVRTPSTADGTDGAYPDAGLIAAAGDPSGTTPGTFTNMDTDEAAATAADSMTTVAATAVPTLTILVSFNGTNEANPYAGLIADAAGDLFGTTAYGGTYGYGTVFEIPYVDGSDASTPTSWASFNFWDGAYPDAGLIADAAGDLFGTTKVGGNGYGTVFEIAKTGTGYASTPTTLVNFNDTNGAYPVAVLIADSAGDLFGTTAGSGAYGYGTVFEIAKTGTGYASTPTTLVNFNGANGANPDAGLFADSAGDLFGTTEKGGANDYGTVFEIGKTGGGYASTPTILASFNGTNGAYPAGSLIGDAAGDLFGTTLEGGAYGDGTVFEIAKTGGSYASTPTTLASFNGADGEEPQGSLIADAAGDRPPAALGGSAAPAC